MGYSVGPFLPGEIDFHLVGMEARGYALSCSLIQRGTFRTEQKRRERLISLGRDIEALCGDSFADYERTHDVTPLFNEYRGMELVISLGQRWLETEEGFDNGNEYASEIREMGINSLSKLGEVLQTAKSPGFNRYLGALNKLFSGLADWADEIIALAKTTCEPPPTKFERDLMRA